VIGLDTNVLVRYLVQDDPLQGAAAADVIESRCTSETPGRVDHVVLCELVWVLETAYGYSRELVGNVVRQVLGTAELLVESPDLAWAALRAYESGPADLADYLIGQRNRAAGCETTLTFDRRAARSGLYTAVGPASGAGR
jgi:predicted nucleic-acid-binding protein